jgi:3-oxoacyl-[acyl-carrier protein] reductase
LHAGSSTSVAALLVWIPPLGREPGPAAPSRIVASTVARLHKIPRVAIEIDLTGRVALVTGGSRGLGRADALALARAGADVVIADLLVESDESEEAAESVGGFALVAKSQGLVHTEETAEQIRALGRRSLAVKCDVTDRAQVAAAVARTVDELGSVDILVNSAATLDHVGQFHDQSPELWERDLRVNLTGSFNCAQAVWPHMRERGWGRIVNMASVAGTLGGFGQASYSTTKAGVLGLTKTLAMEGGRHGITCNAIVPGIIGTEIFHAANAAMNERIASRTVFKRPGEPDDIANAIAFLCSDLAGYITGVELYVSGGVELFVF